ncbi:hypothetical protein BX666DRAFT_216060 [Dichotomocladium elegans]|nr:hypothetical protein BX666DRAFT_216060 [Dichotomocladium elegans]
MTTNMNFGPEWMRPSVSKRSTTSPGQMSEGLVPSNHGENPYKYSKEFMLSLYKPVAPPADFERHEYVSVEESQGPLSFVDLSEEEKKLLSGSVHSEVGRRMMNNNSGNGNNERSNGLRNNNAHRDMYASPLQSPASENTPNAPGRLNASRPKGTSTPSDTNMRAHDIANGHNPMDMEPRRRINRVMTNKMNFQLGVLLIRIR